MADKKLSSVSAVSDMNFVYAETASGETVKISKSDLASVVAGLLPTAYKSKLQYVPAGGSIVINGVGGIMKIRNIYNSSGWDVWFCTEGKATRIATALYNTAVSVTMSGTTATIKNDNDGQRQIEVVYQTLL